MHLSQDNLWLGGYTADMFRIRSILGGLLALTLLLTNVSAGVARGQSTPVGAIEICHGLVTHTVLIDAKGQPVTHVQLCDDGVLALLSTVASADAVPVQEARFRAVSYPVAVGRATGATVPQGGARGPPDLV
ncbi:hypothetical protein [Sagittula sp. SSi028]|uniref:hypothetical protein n=1 Tax=Sagittula sp. SSi028 TaxID=3400636 RepID=UPI003AF65B14